MKNKLYKYFVISGALLHFLILAIAIIYPKLPNKVMSKIALYYYQRASEYEYAKISGSKIVNVAQEIKQTLKPWKPLANVTIVKQAISINGVYFQNVSAALSKLNHGDEIRFHHGIFNTPFVIEKNDITISGYGQVVFERAAYGGKGFIVNQGKNLTVKNIECRFINVADKNGACIRQEGEGLTLEHVYFHDSENGVLETAKNESNIFINDSRFELLGKKGQAHGIYSNKANLYIHNSIFIASKDEGHGIKNRGKKTHITNSLIASLSSDDSRLIDIPNGGELIIENSLLQQGPLSVNGQAIGFGLEGIKYKKNSVNLTGNVILLERIKANTLIAIKDKRMVTIKSNKILNREAKNNFEGNDYYSTREVMFMPDYPYFSQRACHLMSSCPILLSK